MAKIILSYFACIVVIVVSVITSLKAANILAVFPTPSISHQIVFRPLTQELARRGHNITIITADPAFPQNQTPPNLKEIDVHNISYTIWRKELNQFAVHRENNADAIMKIMHLITVVFEHELRSEEIQNLIRNKDLKFDLILAEANVPSLLIFSHIFKAPVIQISSFGAILATNSIIGAPNHPMYQPKVFRHKVYNLTFWEKIYEIYIQFTYEYKEYEHELEHSKMLKDMFGIETPTLRELYNNIHMVFLNVHPIWNDNQPVPPGLIYLGRLHLRPSMELPTDLKTLIDNSKAGVIYVSFGTNVDPAVVPTESIKMMMKVLSELKYDVIWVWKTDMPSNFKNIKVFKWVPQLDILRHKKVKLFITQGGLQSTDEAIDAEVPLIALPVYADQFYNSQKYVRHGIGKQLDINTVTEEQFKDAVVTVLENQSFRNNIVKLNKIINDDPEPPLERAIWWTEYALRHGGAKHLRAPSANMSLTEYYELNIVLFLIACLLSLAYFLYNIVGYGTIRSSKIKLS